MPGLQVIKSLFADRTLEVGTGENSILAHECVNTFSPELFAIEIVQYPAVTRTYNVL